jgi:hypothetical protein
MLIGYGVAAFTGIQVGSSTGLPSQALGSWGSARGFVLLGLGLQLILMLARTLIKHYAPDWASAPHGMMVLEIIADGVTVLLFAMATLGAIAQLANDP